MSTEAVNTEISSIIDEINKNHKQIQDQFGKKEAETAELAKKTGELAQQLQDQTTEIKAQVERQKSLEKTLSSQYVNGNTPAIDPMDQEYRATFTRYLRDKTYQISTPDAHQYAAHLSNQMMIKISGSQSSAEYFSSNQMVEGINGQGGYLVYPQIEAGIQKRTYETSPIRQECSVVSTSTNEYEVNISDTPGGNAHWVGEVEPRTLITASPGIGKIKIPVMEMFSQPSLSMRLLGDASFDVEGFIMDWVGFSMGDLQGTAFIKGVGGSQPRGFMNDTAYPDWAVPSVGVVSKGIYEREKIETMGATAHNAITLDELTALKISLLKPFQQNAKWYMDRLTFGAFLQLKDLQGNPLISTNYLSAGYPIQVLLGKPVVLCPDFDTIGESGVTQPLPLAYGDLRQTYQIVDRSGMYVLKDWITDKGNMLYYTTLRVGGGVRNFQSVKRLRMATAPANKSKK